jgi:microsomal epoxide hydrolase
MWRAILIVLAFLLATPLEARAADRFFTTSDGVRLHYIDVGPRQAPVLLFIPGWTMPAWIFQRQLTDLSPSYHVIAMDPRGQGDSDIPATGYEPMRRGQDIAEMIATLGGRRVTLVGWSLGVLDSLAYVSRFGDVQLSGLVLIDNSVGEDPAPVPGPPTPRARRPRVLREVAMARFVSSMFHRPQDPDYLHALTEAALRTPPEAAAALLSYPVPRSFWREAIYTVHKPILYIVTPRLSGQAANLAARHADVQSDVYTDAGHALFIDDGNRFNAELLNFLQTRVKP